ncbi:MAG: NUDIX hydrolase [Granulosicoccaceae bacterium]|jgi:ADP-ribose pyrophosphatase YjhB (NUDIX family)
MNFCTQCGAGVTHRVPQGDNRPRHVCDQCGHIHYENPKVVAGSIPEWQDRILLCRRAIEPRYGKWTLPAGFMENSETTAQAATRETWEEAGAKVDVTSLFAMISLPHISQVYVMYRAQLPGPDYAAGTESLEVALFREEEIPWQQLAFPVITETLQRYFHDRRSGDFAIHIADMLRLPGDTPRFEVIDL